MLASANSTEQTQPVTAPRAVGSRNGAATPPAVDRVAPRRARSDDLEALLSRAVATRTLLQREALKQSRLAQRMPKRGAATARALLQRDVGFEFQTGWGIQETGPIRQYGRQEVVADYGLFKLTADGAQTALGAEIEFVVPHLPENDRHRMDMALTALEQLAGLMNAHRAATFTLDQATKNPLDADVEVQPTIKQAGDMKANPQVTGGVRMDRLTQLFNDLAQPHGAHSAAQSALVAIGGGPSLGNSAAAVANLTVNGNPASAEFKGLAALILSYLRMGQLATGAPGFNQPTLNYAKASLTLLARTDFVGMYQRLPAQEQLYFTAHPKRFRRKILAAAGGLSATDNVLERGIHNVPVNVSRRRWLDGIPAGIDHLKIATDPRLFGFGSRDQNTDAVGPALGHAGAIFEFRTMNKSVPWTQWRTLGLSTFDYIAALNQ